MEHERNIDWQHVGLLLHIVDKAKDHPRLSHIVNAALAELDWHSGEAKKANDFLAKERAEEEAVAKEKVDAARAMVEEESKDIPPEEEVKEEVVELPAPILRRPRQLEETTNE